MGPVDGARNAFDPRKFDGCVLWNQAIRMGIRGKPFADSPVPFKKLRLDAQGTDVAVRLVYEFDVYRVPLVFRLHPPGEFCTKLVMVLHRHLERIPRSLNGQWWSRHRGDGQQYD